MTSKLFRCHPPDGTNRYPPSLIRLEEFRSLVFYARQSEVSKARYASLINQNIRLKNLQCTSGELNLRSLPPSDHHGR